ncbi:MAG: ABC transporter substrate-binding protein [Candidatus Rokuibacteriota bacterium]|nr:MAG: ABC transporter substrate-binding protein [Candidatus Rokubacteria bacterium]
MRLIGLAVILTLSLALAPLALEAQQPGKVPRVGVLLTGDQSRHLTHVEAFRQGLRERGYVEGKNVVIEYRFGDGKLDRLPQLAAELVGLNVDLIVTSGTPPTRAALQATRTIPIVMTLVGDPIAAGFIASLAKPGGSITGLTQITGELDGKRLELLKEAFPKVSRVAVLFDPGSAAQEGIGTLRDTRMAAEALGVKLLSLELRGPNPDLGGAFRTATSERVGALLVAPGPATELHRKRVVDLAAKSRLPAMYGSNEFVDLGGLMSYGPSQPDLFRRAATHVDKLLKGAKPADLPVEQPTKFELVINLKTAKALGLTIPPSVLGRADQIIE